MDAVKTGGLTEERVREIVNEEVANAISEVFKEVAVGNPGGGLFVKLLAVCNSKIRTRAPEPENTGRTTVTEPGGGRPAPGGVVNIG